MMPITVIVTASRRGDQRVPAEGRPVNDYIGKLSSKKLIELRRAFRVALDLD
jgi:hypothetical protein